MGDLGAAVFDVQAGKPRLLGYVDGTGRVEVTFGQGGAQGVSGLVNVKQGVFAPADAACCPSRLKETVYRWDGAKFAAISTQTLPNPPR